MASDRDKSKEAKEKESDDKSDIKLTDTLKKVISAGIGAAFMTEESIRSYLSDIKLPKEVLQMLLQGASKSKEELVQKIATEVGKNVGRLDFVKEATRFLEEHKFRISAEIQFEKKDK